MKFRNFISVVWGTPLLYDRLVSVLCCLLYFTRPTMKSDVNPAQLQRKREKAQQLKKAKVERQKQRYERLSKRNPGHLERQIRDLEALPSPSRADLDRLKGLKNELKEILTAQEKLGLLSKSEMPCGASNGRSQSFTRDNQQAWRPEKPPGKRSIYWDSVLNPKGYPPEGYPFVDRKYDDEESDYESDSSVSKIPMPVGSYEDALKRASGQGISATPSVAQTVYESAPVLRDLVKETTKLVPTVLKRRKIETKSTKQPPMESAEEDMTTSSRQPYIEDVEEVDNLEEDLEFEYASEEEEYRKNQE